MEQHNKDVEQLLKNVAGMGVNNYNNIINHLNELNKQ
jgi:hypothetical protein